MENLSIDKTWQVPARAESLEQKVEGNKNLFKRERKGICLFVCLFSVEDLKSYKKFKKRGGGR